MIIHKNFEKKGYKEKVYFPFFLYAYLIKD